MQRREREAQQRNENSHTSKLLGRATTSVLDVGKLTKRGSIEVLSSAGKAGGAALDTLSKRGASTLIGSGKRASGNEPGTPDAREGGAAPAAEGAAPAAAPELAAGTSAASLAASRDRTGALSSLHLDEALAKMVQVMAC